MTWECLHGYPEGDGCPVADCPDTAQPESGDIEAQAREYLALFDGEAVNSLEVSGERARTLLGLSLAIAARLEEGICREPADESGQLREDLLDLVQSALYAAVPGHAPILTLSADRGNRAAGTTYDSIGPERKRRTTPSTLSVTHDFETAAHRGHAGHVPANPGKISDLAVSTSAFAAHARGADRSGLPTVESASDGTDVAALGVGGCDGEARHQGVPGRLSLRDLPASEGRGERALPPSAPEDGPAASRRTAGACSREAGDLSPVGLRASGDVDGVLPHAQPLGPRGRRVHRRLFRRFARVVAPEPTGGGGPATSELGNCA